MVYDVPTTTANGGPVLLNATETGKWGETTDLPVTGTAIFTPHHNPAGTTPSTVAASDWPYAGLDYLDVNGQSVNSAVYGAGAWLVDTAQYDADGKPTWQLSAGNRAQALSTTGTTDSYVAAQASNVDRAALLTSTTVYDPLTSQVTDTYGPTHPVTLSDGSTMHARTHVATSFDEGAPNNDVNPNTDQPYDLPTTITTTGYQPAIAADSGFPDAQITRTGYDPVASGDPSGWDTGQVTTTTTQMGASPSGADLVTKTRYDGDGRVIETRRPGDGAGTTPRTTVTAYYTATGTGSCVAATRAGLVCSTGPAAQPSTEQPLPVTTHTYDQYGNPATMTETYGSGSGQVTRASTVAYGAGERPSTRALTVSPASSGGNAIPTVTYGYDSSTGLPTTASTGSGSTLVTLTTGYNNIAEATSYTDANGTVSTMHYDLDGRVTTLNDGQGTTTLTYDSSTEHRGLVTAEDIGVAGSPSTFTASYDASGLMTSETYPNGLVAARTADNADELTQLTYTKPGWTSLTFTQAFNEAGQVATSSSPQSDQRYVYDAADRLTSTADRYQSSCTTRTYSFDTHSNRTALKSYPAGSGGTCSTSTTPTTTSTSYDQADRDTNTGYTYDNLGRTLTVPAADAAGIGAHAANTGTLTIGYYANDMVASQAQGGTSVSFTLDPLQDRIATYVDGATTNTNHYSGLGDSPSWTSTATGYTLATPGT